MQTRTLTHLAEKLTLQHGVTNSWVQTALECDVLTPDGNANPKLALLIAGGYEPRREETRERLGLPATCPHCHQHWAPPRNVPTWLVQAVEHLRELERPQPVGYTRRGRPVQADTLAGLLFESVLDQQPA